MFHIDLNSDQLEFLVELLASSVDRYENEAAALLQIVPQRPVAQELALERLDKSRNAAGLFDLLTDI